MIPNAPFGLKAELVSRPIPEGTMGLISFDDKGNEEFLGFINIGRSK